MKLAITLADQTIHATLLDNPAAAAFAAMLPLTLPMRDLFRREKYATLPAPLPTNAPKLFRYNVGDIAYWSPSRDLAVYYLQDHETIPSPGIIPLATIDSGTDLFHRPGTVTATFRLLP